MERAKRWLWPVGILLAGLAVVWLMSRESPVVVQTASVSVASLETVVEEEGRTRARDRYLIAAPIAGTAARLEVREGESVESGAVVARVFPAEQDPRALAVAGAQLSAAEARLEAARAQAVEAEGVAVQTAREAERRAALLELGAISREQWERSVLEAEAAARNLDAATAALRAAEADAASARAQAMPGGQGGGGAIEVRAPVSGVVLRVFERSERAVAPGAPLLELAEVGGLELVVDVLTEDAVRIRPGQPMRLVEWGGGEVLHGTVRLVEPDAFTKLSALGVEEQRVNVVGDLSDPPAALGTGYRFVAQIVTSSAEALSAPNSAFFRSGSTWSVFVIEDGRAVRREVELGRRGVDRSEILAGLGDGEEVLLFPSDLVSDGVRVVAEAAR